MIVSRIVPEDVIIGKIIVLMISFFIGHSRTLLAMPIVPNHPHSA